MADDDEPPAVANSLDDIPTLLDFLLLLPEAEVNIQQTFVTTSKTKIIKQDSRSTSKYVHTE